MRDPNPAESRMLAVCDLITEPIGDLDETSVANTAAEQIARLTAADAGLAVLHGPNGLVMGTYPRPVPASTALLLLDRAIDSGQTPIESLAAGMVPGDPGACWAPIQGERYRGLLASLGSLDGGFSPLDEWLVMVAARRVEHHLGLIALHHDRMAQAAVVDDAGTAGMLQQSMLPDDAPAVPGVTVAGKLRPARLAGGDFYDWFGCGRQLVAVIADVSGKGTPAAMMMGAVHATVARAVAELGAEPEAVLAAVGRDIGPLLDRTGKMVTMAIAAIDPLEGRLRIANAGHSPVIIRTRSGAQLDRPAAPPLGVPGFGVRGREYAVDRGDLVLFATDGVTDQRSADGTVFGADRLRSAVAALGPASAATAVDHIVDVLDRHADSTAQDDDQALVIARVGEQG